MCEFNFMLLEWLCLFIVYCEEVEWMVWFCVLVEWVFFSVKVWYYYIFMVRKNFWEYLYVDEVCYKKYFYVLCLLFVVCWICDLFGVLLMCFVELVQCMLDVMVDVILIVEINVLLEVKMCVGEFVISLCWVGFYDFIECELVVVLVYIFGKDLKVYGFEFDQYLYDVVLYFDVEVWNNN